MQAATTAASFSSSSLPSPSNPLMFQPCFSTTFSDIPLSRTPWTSNVPFPQYSLTQPPTIQPLPSTDLLHPTQTCSSICQTLVYSTQYISVSTDFEIVSRISISCSPHNSNVRHKDSVYLSFSHMPISPPTAFIVQLQTV